MTKKLLIALTTLALAAFALAACGGDDEDDGGATTAAEETSTAAEEPAGDGGTVSVEAVEDGSFAFTETELSTAAGANTVEFDNPSSTPHNVYIEDDGGSVIAETETVTGDSTSATAELEAGTYTYFCDIPGHREGGMEGTLTVE